MTDIVLVNDLKAAADACAELKKHRVLALDMEGAQLGRDGQTLLLQLAARRTEVVVVYIFDVMVLGNELFSNVLAPILQNPSITKLCYDCRCDAEALFYAHGILPEGLYDLQIAYTNLFQASTDPYLKGLHRALQAPGVLPADSQDQVLKMKSETKRQSDFGAIMMQRPLPAAVLEYCASDVEHLFTMYELWSGHTSCNVARLTKQRMLRFIYRDRAWCMSRLDFGCVMCRAPRHNYSSRPAQLLCVD
jgi:exonuclease 3'-5' domain-containing protein 1